MNKVTSLADLRREYGKITLDEQCVGDDPMHLLNAWMTEVLDTEHEDPTAMVLSTVDEDGHPDSRVVLLKGIDDSGFLFFTNYNSAKGKQLKNKPFAALNFYWPSMARQIRVKGSVKKVSEEQSDRYFFSRPLTSQLGAIASPQSEIIANRSVLDDALNQLIQQYEQNSTICRPEHWGGYCLIPSTIEFWQGRDNRLHDRITYFLEGDRWHHYRLAP
jgi:pyridoxamine 5'-phosphate oxidase